MAKIDTFRESALTFLEKGSYCPYPSGSRSAKLFWQEETRRCVKGYHVGWDEIPGYFYWYLNYCPIDIVIPTKDKNGLVVIGEDGQIQGERKRTFPQYWDGDYKYYHYLDEAERGGKHGVVLKTRGRGYSFKGGSMMTRNYFLIPNSKSYAIADQTEYLTKDGIITKAFEMMSFIDENTAWSKRRDFKNTDMHRRASFKITKNGVPKESGFLSEIIGVTFKNDPNRARGKRGKLILWEEAGKFPGLLQGWNIARSSMEQGKTTFGLMVAFGTGGTEGADFEAMDELFYNPKGYNILPVNNVWEEGKEEQICGFFMPEYMNRDGCMDEDGNSLIEKANKEIDQERDIIINFTKDREAFKRAVAEKPRIPTEATMKTTGNIFPVIDLLGVLSRLELDTHYERSLLKGKFTLTEKGEPEFRSDNSLRIMYNYPHKSSENTDAPVIIYEPPFQNESGAIPHGLYVAGIDPYDHDQSNTLSLGSTLIINKLTNRIVAEYTARPETSKEYYEQVRRLLIYYNARALYENERKGIFDYFESQNSLYLLCEEPRIIHDIIKKPGISRKFGLPMPIQIKNYGVGLIKQWLLSPNPAQPDVLNLHRIRSFGLLKELIAFDMDKNTDRAMALMCIMYQLQEERNYIPNVDDKPRVKRFTDSDFFTRAAVKESSVVKQFRSGLGYS